MSQLPLKEMTVNGLPVSSLSEAGQKIFQKIMELRQEADALAKQKEDKEATMKGLTEILVSEITAIQAAQATSATEPA